MCVFEKEKEGGEERKREFMMEGKKRSGMKEREKETLVHSQELACLVERLKCRHPTKV